MVALRIVLDTNRYVDLARGDADVVGLVESAAEVLVPFVVLAELQAGFALGTRRVDNERRLSGFLRESGVSTLWADEPTLAQYAAVFRQLRAQGTPIPTNDLWIAALALRHAAPLFTRDDHFRLIPQLTVISSPGPGS